DVKFIPTNTGGGVADAAGEGLGEDACGPEGRGSTIRNEPVSWPGPERASGLPDQNASPALRVGPSSSATTTAAGCAARARAPLARNTRPRALSRTVVPSLRPGPGAAPGPAPAGPGGWARLVDAARHAAATRSMRTLPPRPRDSSCVML